MVRCAIGRPTDSLDVITDSAGVAPSERASAGRGDHRALGAEPGPWPYRSAKRRVAAASILLRRRRTRPRASSICTDRMVRPRDGVGGLGGSGRLEEGGRERREMETVAWLQIAADTKRACGVHY